MTSLLDHPLFLYGLTLSNQRFYHAALELWTQLDRDVAPFAPSSEQARLSDEIGKAYIQLADLHRALEAFTSAVSRTDDEEASLLYQMHVAMTYGRFRQYDRAQRLHTQLAARAEGMALPPMIQGYLHSNLAYLQARNGFYREAVYQTLVGLEFFREVNARQYIPDLYTNLGFLHIELQNYEDAETYLSAAYDLYEKPLPAITELCRLSLIRGQFEQSAAYAEQALEWIWSSFINYEKEEIARLCYLFGQLAFRYSERGTALHLVEKAQLFFGQLGSWDEWTRVQSVMDNWEQAVIERTSELQQSQVQQLSQFVLLLDAMNAQEILNDRFSSLMDTRVLYARKLGKALSMSAEEDHQLVYASRFADYGLTALEPEVVFSPHRSPQAWAHYRVHPELSIRMLQDIQLSSEITELIRDHHERHDGSGYPAGKHGSDIHLLTHVLVIADEYATGLVMEERPHSDVIMRMLGQQEKYHPELLDTFLSLFATPADLI